MTRSDETAAPTLLGLLAAAFRRAPHAIAVRDTTECWTYQQLWQESGRVIAAIRAAECPPGGRVVLGMAPGCRWVASLLGIWRAGTIAVLSNVEHPPVRLCKIAGSAEFVLMDSTSSAIDWPGRLGRIVVDDATEPLMDELPRLDAALTTLACILHTSGSSGTPKPVVLEYASLADRITQFQALYRIVVVDRIAQLAAPSVDVILWETLLALTSGARLEIPGGPARIPGPDLARWLIERGITVIACTPTMLAALPEVSVPMLRLIVLGGEKLHPARHRFWIEKHQVANAYGPTEATIATHVCLDVTQQCPAPIGHAVAGVLDYLLDDTQHPVHDGEIGELYVGGTGLAAQYDDLPETTAAAFPTLVLDGTPLRVYRTGDRAWRRPDGQLVFVGRVDRQLNLGGFRLEPGEVEIAATAMSGVTAAAVLAAGEPDHQVLVLHAAVPAENVTPTELRAHLASLLPAPAVPARIYLWRNLPMTDSGKPDLPTLAARSSYAAPDGLAPQTKPVELPEQVTLWWSEATGTLPSEGGDFFDSGGDSLGAVRMLHRVNETYSTAITVTAFVADPTPEHLAHVLSGHGAGAL